MNTMRFAKAEMKKTLKRPSLYIIAAFLAVLLVVTIFLFNPSNVKINNPADIPLSFVGVTAAEIKSEFDSSYKQDYANIYSENITNINNFYVNNTKTIKTLYNPTSLTERGLYTKLDDAFNFYYWSESLSEFNDRQNLVSARIDEFEIALNGLFNTAYPVVVVSKSAYEEIIETVRRFKTLFSESLTLEGHQALRTTIEREGILNSLQRILRIIKDVSLSGDFLAQLFADYGTELATRQAAQLADLNAAVGILDVAEGRAAAVEACRRYISISLMAERLYCNNLYIKIIEKMDDAQISNDYKLYKNQFLGPQNSIYSSSTTFKYDVKEQITRDDYLWTNGRYDYEFDYNFSKFALMGEKENAFDYAFYALEIVGFFIIMMAVLIASTSISGEYYSGTIKMIAIRPYSRRKILGGKLLSAFLFATIFIIFAAAVTFAIGAFSFGLGSGTILTVFSSDVVLIVSPYVMFLIYVIAIILKAFIFICIALMLSVLFRSNVAAIISSLFIYILGPAVNSFAPHSKFLTFIPFVNIDIFKFFGRQYYTGAAANSAQNLFASFFTTPNLFSNNIFYAISFALITISITLAIAFSVFKTRDI